MNNLTVYNLTTKNLFSESRPFISKLSLEDKSQELIERFLSILLLILFLPIMITVALAIKLTMGGSIFYSQIRVGKNGREFKIYKFRSMIENAEKVTGPVLSSKNDARVTKLGKFLRKSHLDEFPQLYNVLIGDMSFVGPRPERPEFVKLFEKEIPDYIKRSEVKPGITGLAQICLPYDATPSEKLEYDLFYISKRKSIIFNTFISYQTAIKMLNVF